MLNISVFNTPDRTSNKYPDDFIEHWQANTLSNINITRVYIKDAIKSVSQNSSGGPDEFTA